MRVVALEKTQQQSARYLAGRVYLLLVRGSFLGGCFVASYPPNSKPLQIPRTFCFIFPLFPTCSFKFPMCFPRVSTYIISLGGRPFHPSVPSSIHPSKSSLFGLLRIHPILLSLLLDLSFLLAHSIYSLYYLALIPCVLPKVLSFSPI
jgi:hypothetical protein